jgi:UPF0716 protein FxsA
MSLVAFLVFVIAPIIEIVSIVLVAQLIGWWTLAALLAAALLGAYVLRRTGRDWLRRISAKEQPGRATGDSAMLFAAGILLIIPGFASDVIALLLLLPFVRVLLRGAAAAWFIRRFTAVTGPGGFTVWQRGGRPPMGTAGGPPITDDPRVIRGEIVRDDVPPEGPASV